MASEVKEEVKESCEMENSEVRFYDVRSSKEEDGEETWEKMAKRRKVERQKEVKNALYECLKIQFEIFSFEPLWQFPRQMRGRILLMDFSSPTSRTLLASSGGSKRRPPISQRVLQAKLLWPWPRGEYDCCCPFL